MIVGIVISAVVGALALITRADARRIGPSPTRTGGGLRWHWWWLLIAGWGGYIAGIGGRERRGAARSCGLGRCGSNSGAPLSTVFDVPATCATVPGKPAVVASIVADDDRLPPLEVLDRVTWRPALGRPRVLRPRLDRLEAAGTDPGHPGPAADLPARPDGQSEDGRPADRSRDDPVPAGLWLPVGRQPGLRRERDRALPGRACARLALPRPHRGRPVARVLWADGPLDVRPRRDAPRTCARPRARPCRCCLRDRRGHRRPCRPPESP